MRTIHKLCAICIMLLLGAVNSYGQCDQAFIDKCSQTSATIKYVKHFRIRFTEAMKGKSISEGKFAIMLNINASTGAEYPAFDFICSKTGPYFLKMHFKDGKEGCGVCVMTLVTN